jgi:Flp pilus assembly protein TadD
MTMDPHLEKFVTNRWELAQSEFKNQRWAKARTHAAIVDLIAPHLARPKMIVAMCLAPLSLTETTLIMMRRAYMATPGDVLVLTRFSEALFAAGHFEDAEQAIRKALDLGAHGGEGNFLLARIVWARKRTAEAREILDQAVEVDPEIVGKRRIMEYTISPEDFA